MPRLFLVQYTEFCLCYAALFLGQAAGSSAAVQQSTRIAPALLPDPDPPAPTSVGETYKIPGRQLGEAICEKRGAFLDGCHVHPPLSLSGD